MSYVKQHVLKREIKKITDKLGKYTDAQIEKTQNYELKLILRDIDPALFKKHFREFDKVKLINEDVGAKGDLMYDLFYELSNRRTLVIGTIPLKNKLKITHMYVRYRELQRMIKNIARGRR